MKPEKRPGRCHFKDLRAGDMFEYGGCRFTKLECYFKKYNVYNITSNVLERFVFQGYVYPINKEENQMKKSDIGLIVGMIDKIIEEHPKSFIAYHDYQIILIPYAENVNMSKCIESYTNPIGYNSSIITEELDHVLIMHCDVITHLKIITIDLRKVENVNKMIEHVLHEIDCMF